MAAPIYLTRDRRFGGLRFDVAIDLDRFIGSVWQNADGTWSHSDDVTANEATRDDAVGDLWRSYMILNGGGR